MVHLSHDIAKVTLTFHSGTTEYLPGCVLAGVVTLKLNKELSIRAIRLRIRAEEYARVGLDPSSASQTHVHYDQIYTFTREAHKDGSKKNSFPLFPGTGAEKGDFMTPAELLSPGAHEYPFAVDLPDFLPPTFEVRCKLDSTEARLKHTAKVYVDVRPGFEVECIQPFYVLSPVSRLVYAEKMNTRGGKILSSHVQLKTPLGGLFSFFRKESVVETKVRVEPKIILMDVSAIGNGFTTTIGDGKRNSGGSSNSNNNFDPLVFVYVTIVNKTHETLDTVRVRLVNVVRVKLGHLRSSRRVDIGEPFIHNETIKHGEEKSFLAQIHPHACLPYSTLGSVGKGYGEAKRHVTPSSSHQREQKWHVLYEQPLMSLTTAFVNSHCAVSVDFPKYRSKAPFVEVDVLLAGTVDAATNSLWLPPLCNNMVLWKRPCAGNYYPFHHNSPESTEDTRYTAPILPYVHDPTGILPAYTAGKWTYESELEE